MAVKAQAIIESLKAAPGSEAKFYHYESHIAQFERYRKEFE